MKCLLQISLVTHFLSTVLAAQPLELKWDDQKEKNFWKAPSTTFEMRLSNKREHELVDSKGRTLITQQVSAIYILKHDVYVIQSAPNRDEEILNRLSVAELIDGKWMVKALFVSEIGGFDYMGKTVQGLEFRYTPYKYGTDDPLQFEAKEPIKLLVMENKELWSVPFKKGEEVREVISPFSEE